eukprot:PhF_6_TR37933/c0_g1_i2/m.56709
MYAKFVCLFVLCIITVGCAAPPPSPTTTIHMTYKGTTKPILNPDRGFRYELDQILNITQTTAQLQSLLAMNITVAQSYVYLPWTSMTLSASLLQQLQLGFDLLRQYNLRALLRFAYDLQMPGEGNYTFEMIYSHITQLSPIVLRNADVIYALQAGFVGSWGEWHSSKNNLESNETGLSELVRREIAMLLPPSRFVQVRVPSYKSEKVLRPNPPPPGFNWTFDVVNAATAFMGDNPVARIGYDDDGFLQCNNDGGTWQMLFPTEDGSLVDYGFTYMTMESPYVSVDGEMFWMSGIDYNVVDGHSAAHRLRMQHYTTLSHAHGYFPIGFSSSSSRLQQQQESINLWMVTPLNVTYVSTWQLPIEPEYFQAAHDPTKNITIYDYIRDHLGYRIRASRATIHLRKNSLDVTLVVQNYGFAVPLNQKDIFFALIPTNATTMDKVLLAWVSTNGDVRKWQPYIPNDPSFRIQEHTIQGTFSFNNNDHNHGGSGGITYSLGVWIVAPCEERDKKKVQQSFLSVRFANEGMGFW